MRKNRIFLTFITLLVFMTSSAEANVNGNYYGEITAFSKENNGEYVLKGWACEKDSPRALDISISTEDYTSNKLNVTSKVITIPSSPKIREHCNIISRSPIGFNIFIPKEVVEKHKGRTIYASILSNQSFVSGLENSGKYEIESDADKIVTLRMRAIANEIPKNFKHYLTWTPVELRRYVGNNTHIPISRFYDNLDDVYADFNLDEKHFERCEKRSQAWKKFRTVRWENAVSTNSQCVDLDDSIDWFALQSALFNGKNGWVILTQAKQWTINQSLVLFNNQGVKWKENSYIKFSPAQEDSIAGSGSIGTILIGGLNPYSMFPTVSNYHPDRKYSLDKKTVKNVSNIFLLNPHIDSGSFVGENGISFAGGASNILIFNGQIKNVYFDKDRQGGKAVQCELGCTNLIINELQIENASFGVSASVHPQAQWKLPFENASQATAFVRNIKMTNVDVPFNALNAGADREEAPIAHSVDQAIKNIRNNPKKGQLLYVNGFQLTNSGALSSNTSIRNENAKYIGSCLATSSDVGYHLDDNSELFGTDSAGILYIHGGQNIFLKNGQITNKNYPRIGGVIRGDFGKNIKLSNIVINGETDSVINLTPGYNGITSPIFELENASFHDITQLDHTKHIVKLSNHYFSRQLENNQCYYKRSYNKINNIQLSINAENIDEVANEITLKYLSMKNKEFGKKRHFLSFKRNNKEYKFNGSTLRDANALSD